MDDILTEEHLILIMLTVASVILMLSSTIPQSFGWGMMPACPEIDLR